VKPCPRSWRGMVNGNVEIMIYGSSNLITH
jgi:hypothetical protein